MSQLFASGGQRTGASASSNQSILKEISPEISLEGMMQKLKLQSFGHLMRRVDSVEKTLMLGGIGGRRSTDTNVNSSDLAQGPAQLPQGPDGGRVARR